VGRVTGSCIERFIKAGRLQTWSDAPDHSSVLVFDITDVDSQVSRQLRQHGLDDSGTPTIIDFGGDERRRDERRRIVDEFLAEGAEGVIPMILVADDEFLRIDGPTGEPSEIVRAACALESEQIRLRQLSIIEPGASRSSSITVSVQ
jgi:hypothetical protein